MRCIFKSASGTRCTRTSLKNRTVCYEHVDHESIPAMPGDKVMIRGEKSALSTDGCCGELIRYIERPEPNKNQCFVNAIYATIALEDHSLKKISVPTNKVILLERKNS